MKQQFGKMGGSANKQGGVGMPYYGMMGACGMGNMNHPMMGGTGMGMGMHGRGNLKEQGRTSALHSS